MDNSIYYDVKARPLNHFKAFHHLGQLLQSLTCKSFIVYPLRTSYIPAHITIDTLIMNYHILGSKKSNYQKGAVWEEILQMHYRALKKQGINKTLCFQGTMLTDGVNVTIVKQNFESGRRRKNDATSTSDQLRVLDSKGKKRKSTCNSNDEEFTHIENLTMKQLRETKDKCVLIDPSRCDVLYCMKESSKPQQRNVFRFTQCQRNKKSRRLRYLREKLKPECVKLAESQLCEFPSATLDVKEFIKYMKARRLVELKLKSYYSNETLKETPTIFYPDPLDFFCDQKGDIYYGKRLLFIKRVHNARPGIADLPTYIQFLILLISLFARRLTKSDINQLNKIIKDTAIWLSEEERCEDGLEAKMKQVKLEAHQILSKLLVLPFRRLKFVSKIYHDKCDIKLAKDLNKSFGEDAVLVDSELV